MTKPSSFAVIGAGISGLSCASELQKHGVSVQVFEKSRGPGGRMATRRHGEATFDHGAQFFRVRSESFAEQLSQWEGAGCVARWEGRFGRDEAGDLIEDSDTRVRWVGAPKMNAITRHLSKPLQVHWQRRVVGLSRNGGVWQLRFEHGEEVGGFDGVVLSCPGPQAAALSPPDSAVHRRAESLRYGVCWAAMLGMEERLSIPFDGIHGDGALAWMARDSSKPGRPSGDRWVLHASPEFSAEHLNAVPADMGQRMAEMFVARFGGRAEHVQSHRWLYALAEESVGSESEWDERLKIGLCGDALVGARVESAWESGRFLAKSILG